MKVSLGHIDTGAVLQVTMLAGLAGDEGGQQEEQESEIEKTHQLSDLKRSLTVSVAHMAFVVSSFDS